MVCFIHQSLPKVVWLYLWSGWYLDRYLWPYAYQSLWSLRDCIPPSPLALHPYRGSRWPPQSSSSVVQATDRNHLPSS
ncbi:hypothetical protein PAXRUDRAFT_129195 [Paxillus rubicundulus Ve08.2h10]|uniref:Uncharacterized protein n=1 Tax=Paxillus rubicundulus Ve08.2h10 TaxID=930991 RepID=A0A0D0ED88_9AGAM|nr:hypothetical protein PAXRUDRAFT_129195 [Paxillus rubicundulus Ve08.2h10]